MTKLNSNEIIKLLDALVGSTEPIGETNYDLEVSENLKIVIDICDWCLDGVLYARQYIGRPERSMHEVGFKAQCIMQEWKEWLIEKEKEWRKDENDDEKGSN